jgi:DNA-binding winged helix-turn-helix (wHTH) protein
LKNLDVQIHHIRKKLEQTKSPHWIETVWGDGYMLHKEPLPANVPISAQGFALYRPLAQRISAQAERKPVSPIGSKPTRQCKCGRGETRPNQNNCHACNREANTKYRQSLRAAAA